MKLFYRLNFYHYLFQDCGVRVGVIKVAYFKESFFLDLASLARVVLQNLEKSELFFRCWSQSCFCFLEALFYIKLSLRNFKVAVTGVKVVKLWMGEVRVIQLHNPASDSKKKDVGNTLYKKYLLKDKSIF